MQNQSQEKIYKGVPLPQHLKWVSLSSKQPQWILEQEIKAIEMELARLKEIKTVHREIRKLAGLPVGISYKPCPCCGRYERKKHNCPHNQCQCPKTAVQQQHITQSSQSLTNQSQIQAKSFLVYPQYQGTQVIISSTNPQVTPVYTPITSIDQNIIQQTIQQQQTIGEIKVEQPTHQYIYDQIKQHHICQLCGAKFQRKHSCIKLKNKMYPSKKFDETPNISNLKQQGFELHLKQNQSNQEKSFHDIVTKMWNMVNLKDKEKEKIIPQIEKQPSNNNSESQRVRYKRHADEVLVLNNIKLSRNILRKIILNVNNSSFWYIPEFDYLSKNIYKEDRLDLFGKRKRRKKQEIYAAKQHQQASE